MSNLNVKKVLVETSKENFTVGKEYEVFKEAGYTYIVDEVNDRVYFDLENKTFGYFSKKNVGLFSFREGDLTLVEVKEDKGNDVGKLTKVKQVGGASYLETGTEYAVEYDGSVPFILDEVGDRMYFDLEAQTYGYFRKENVDSWSFCEYNGVFLEEVEQTDLEEGVMTGANEVKIEEGLKFKVVQDLVLEGARYQEGDIYTLGEELNFSDGVNYAVHGENGDSFINLADELKEAFDEGYFEVLEEATQVEVQADKVPRCITFKDIKEGKIKVGDRVGCEGGVIYEVLEVDVRDTDLPLRLTQEGWWDIDYRDIFRVKVEVTYLDFQEDREPLATYGAEEVEIVEEGGKLVVYSKENK